MGIRYYAYAFDADRNEEAQAHPRRFIGSDPLADAWGFEPGATGVIHPSFQQALPKEEFLYLDKAWQALQAITRDGRENGHHRPCFRMFEGEVDWHGYCYDSWIRAISPEEVMPIAEDLRRVIDEESAALTKNSSGDGESREHKDDYLMPYLRDAERFLSGLADQGRGFVYTIG